MSRSQVKGCNLSRTPKALCGIKCTMRPNNILPSSFRTLDPECYLITRVAVPFVLAKWGKRDSRALVGGIRFTIPLRATSKSSLHLKSWVSCQRQLQARLLSASKQLELRWGMVRCQRHWDHDNNHVSDTEKANIASGGPSFDPTLHATHFPAFEVFLPEVS